MSEIPSDRRGDLRTELLGEIHGEVSVFEPVTIHEICSTGAQVDTHVPLQLNSLHQFRFVLGDRSVVVRGRVAHCHVSQIANRGAVYRSGIEFVEVSNHVEHEIEHFLGAIRSAREPI